MRYSDATTVTKARAEEAFASADNDAICETLVALALHEPDWSWTQERCIEFTYHADWTLRAIAATCLGHLARIHRSLDVDRVKPRLLALMDDPKTRGYAEAAAGDIKMFMGLDVA